MAEYVYNEIQRVQPNQNVLLLDSIPCNRGYVLHRNGSGILTLRGCVNGSGCFARYQVTANMNIAVPSDGTVGPISVSLAIDGEPIQTSKAIFTPAAVGDFGNVGADIIVSVPCICRCASVSVRNTSTQPIDVQNANLVIDFAGIRR